MNYGQFFNMIPETCLVLMLIITFVMDFVLGYDLKKKQQNDDADHLTSGFPVLTPRSRPASSTCL